MKTLLKTLALGLVLVVASCAEEKPVFELISGTIENGANTPVKLLVDDEAIDSTVTDSAGNFVLTTELEEESYAVLDIGGERLDLFLSPKVKTNISADYFNLSESVKFEGDYASLHEFLNKKLAYQEAARLMSSEVYYMTPDNALLFLDSVQPVLLSQLNEAIRASKGDVPELFRANEEADIRYSVAIIKQKYPAYYKYYAQVDSVDLPKRFDSYKEDLSFTDEMLANNPSYKNYIDNAMQDAFGEAYMADTNLMEKTTYADFYMNWIEENLTSAKVKAEMSFRVIKEQLKYYGLNDIEPYLDGFLSSTEDLEKVEEIKDLRGKWEAIAIGNRGPGFRYYNFNGDSTSLATFRGKYVYIDAWATWCGPCKREIPSLEKLQEEFKGEDIVFMSVSLDAEDDKEKWETFVEENELKGVQLFAGDAFKSSLAQDYFINSIPRFILIDREGKIADPSMTRPSNPKTAEKLSELLQKAV